VHDSTRVISRKVFCRAVPPSVSQLSLVRSAEAMRTLSNLNGRASKGQALVVAQGAGEDGAGLAADGRPWGVDRLSWYLDPLGTSGPAGKLTDANVSQLEQRSQP
jgi:hypothetical protein